MADALQTGLRGRSPHWGGSRLLAWSAVAVFGIASVAALALYRDGRFVHADPVSIATVVDARLDARAGATDDRARANDIAAVAAEAVGIAPASVRARFDASDDLYAYVQSLEAAVRENDADAIWMVSRVYDYCSSFAMAPAAYDRDTRAIGEMNMRGSPAMVAARQRVGQRCARFVPQDQITPQLVFLKRMDAAQAGSLAAEAALMASGSPLQETPEYKRDLVQRVQRSGDPEAYSALSPGMGIAASGQPALADQVAGTQFAELAWQLAACRLGMDCGPEGALMTSYCANGGICSRDPQQDFERFVFDAAVPRQGAEVINEMIDSLMREKRTNR